MSRVEGGTQSPPPNRAPQPTRAAGIIMRRQPKMASVPSPKCGCPRFACLTYRLLTRAEVTRQSAGPLGALRPEFATAGSTLAAAECDEAHAC